MKPTFTFWLGVAALVAFALFLLCGCGSTKIVSDQTTTTVHDHIIQPNIIHDTIKVSVDTPIYISGETVIKGDTIIKVQYFPVEKKFIVYAKPDTIHVKDTLIKQVIVNQKEPGFFEKVFTWIKQSLTLVIIIAAFLFFISLYLKFKK